MTFEQLIKEAVHEAMAEYFSKHSNGHDVELLTAAQVAGMLGLKNRNAVYTLRREGKLKGIDIGPNSVRFSREEVDRFIRERTA